MTHVQAAGVPRPSLHSIRGSSKNKPQKSTALTRGGECILKFNSLTLQQKEAVLDMASGLDSFWAIFLQSSNLHDELTWYLEQLATEYLQRPEAVGAL